MTIKVIIKNDDTVPKNVALRVSDADRHPDVILKSGESLDFSVHAGKKLEITEVEIDETGALVEPVKPAPKKSSKKVDA